MSTAKSKEQYIKVWNNHISELSNIHWVFASADKRELCNELMEIRKRLKEMVLIAGDMEFEDHFPEPPVEKNYVL